MEYRKTILEHITDLVRTNEIGDEQSLGDIKFYIHDMDRNFLNDYITEEELEYFTDDLAEQAKEVVKNYNRDFFEGEDAPEDKLELLRETYYILSDEAINEIIKDVRLDLRQLTDAIFEHSNFWVTEDEIYYYAMKGYEVRIPMEDFKRQAIIQTEEQVDELMKLPFEILSDCGYNSEINDKKEFLLSCIKKK